MTITDIEKYIINTLQKRGFNVRKIAEKLYVANKELSPIGIKKRHIFCLLMFHDGELNLDIIKYIHKVFDEHKPKAWRTFFFYNIILVTSKGFTAEALKYIRKKLTNVWNIRPFFFWDMLQISYTTITHIIDLQSKSIIYPYPYEELQTLIHREMREFITEITEELSRF